VKSNLNKKLVLQVGNIIGYIGTVIVNALANIIPIGGKNTGELSDQYPNLFVPAGLTFSIWGVIYLLFALFVIYQARDIYKSENEKLNMPFLDQIGYGFIIASAANISWIFFWHYEFVLISLFVMIALFASLLYIYLRLDIGRSEVPRNEKLLVHIPFSVYIGWITVATVANVTAVLVDAGVQSFGPLAEFLTVVVIVVVVIITLLMLWTRKDIAYSLVVVWAALGIVIKQISQNLLIAIVALIALIIVVIGIFYIGYMHYIKNQERSEA